MSDTGPALEVKREASPGEWLADTLQSTPEPTVHDNGETRPNVAVPALASPIDPDVAAGSAGGFDQLSRIEDKTARIEEKYARSEARMQRVVDKVDAAMDRMNNVALQGDLAAVRGEIGVVSRRIKTLPGFGALLLTAALTAIVTVALLVALLRYYPALLAR